MQTQHLLMETRKIRRQQKKSNVKLDTKLSHSDEKTAKEGKCPVVEEQAAPASVDRVSFVMHATHFLFALSQRTST